MTILDVLLIIFAIIGLFTLFMGIVCVVLEHNENNKIINNNKQLLLNAKSILQEAYDKLDIKDDKTKDKIKYIINRLQ